MIITIELLPSGFYMLTVNHVWIDASIPTLEAAREKAAALVALENKRQNEQNCFRDIHVAEIVDGTLTNVY